MQAIARHTARKWASALKRANPKEWDSVSDIFLRRLRARGNARLMDDVLQAMTELLAEDAPLQVRVISAKSLSKAEQDALVKKVYPQRETRITTAVDETLLGGAIVQTADEQWDFSVKRQLERLNHSLIDA